MARGWESKSVEEQQSQAVASLANALPLSQRERTFRHEKESLEMSLSRVAHQLEEAQNPLHRKMLEQARSHLEDQIRRLAQENSNG